MPTDNSEPMDLADALADPAAFVAGMSEEVTVHTAGTGHTPGPWRLTPSGTTIVAGFPDPDHGYPRGRTVAKLTPDFLGERLANAQRIVRAVNCHDDLLAACMTAACEEMLDPELLLAEIRRQARAAIAKAVGK